MAVGNHRKLVEIVAAHHLQRTHQWCFWCDRAHPFQRPHDVVQSCERPSSPVDHSVLQHNEAPSPGRQKLLLDKVLEIYISGNGWAVRGHHIADRYSLDSAFETNLDIAVARQPAAGTSR